MAYIVLVILNICSYVINNFGMFKLKTIQIFEN